MNIMSLKFLGSNVIGIFSYAFHNVEKEKKWINERISFRNFLFIVFSIERGNGVVFFFFFEMEWGSFRQRQIMHQLENLSNPLHES